MSIVAFTRTRHLFYIHFSIDKKQMDDPVVDETSPSATSGGMDAAAVTEETPSASGGMDAKAVTDQEEPQRPSDQAVPGVSAADEAPAQELPESVQQPTDPPQNEQPKPDKPNPFILPRHPFACENCGFRMFYNYKGTRPPFAQQLTFAEPCYIVLDPFKPPPARSNQHSYFEHFITLGCDCYSCGKTVCSAPQCNIFYRHHFCGDCAHASVDQFPLDVQSRIRKNLSVSR